MPLRRTGLGLRKPPADISGFPTKRVRKGTALYRAHHKNNGPWWFSSDDGGRFNLDPPAGTCYLAMDEETALRERLGRGMLKRGVVSQGWADETVVSRVSVHRGGQVANTCHREATNHGITREIATYARTGYGLTRMWARRFHALGLRGVLYESRFTTITAANAYALFDEAGPKSWPDDPAPAAGVDACLRAGLQVIALPSVTALRIVPTA